MMKELNGFSSDKGTANPVNRFDGVRFSDGAVHWFVIWFNNSYVYVYVFEI